MREELRLRYANSRVGGNQFRFSLANVGTTFEKLRRQTDGNLCGMWLIVNATSAIDILRRVAKKNADGVLLHDKFSTKLRHVGARGVKQFLGLAGVGARTCTILFKRLCKLQRVLASLNGVLRDLELPVQAAQLEVRRGQLLDQCGAGRTLRPLRLQKFGACGLRLPAIQPPEVKVPSGRGAEATAADEVVLRPVRIRVREARRNLQRGETAASTHRWQPLRAHHTHLRLCFEDALRRNLEIKIVLQRFGNELLEHRIGEDALPVLLGDGRLRLCRPIDLRGERSAKALRHGSGRALIARSNLAAGNHHRKYADGDCLPEALNQRVRFSEARHVAPH